MRNIFLKGIIFSLGFCLTIGAFIVSYAAWANLSTRTNGTTIDENIWNEMVGKINELGTVVPTGAVMAFNLSSCPSGWIVADGTNSTPDLRGEFIRGLDNGRGIDSGRVLASFQSGSQISSVVYSGRAISVSNIDNTISLGNQSYYGSSNGTTPAIGYNIRPRNIALLYCIKQ